MIRAMRFALLVTLVAGVASVAGAQSLGDAEKLYRDGQGEEAGRVLREWVAGDASAMQQPPALALLARTAADPEEAASLYDQLLALGPGDALASEAYWMKGLHAYSAGRYVAAGRHFETLAKDFSSRFPRGRALLWKGLSELAADSAATAVATLRQAEKGADGEDAAGVDFGLAHAFLALGQPDEALRRYEKFERDHRNDERASAAARRQVECLRLLGRETEATFRATRIERDYPGTLAATLAREVTRAPDPAPTPAEVEAARYVVQVAALTDPANAARLAQQVRGLKLGTVRIEKTEGPDGALHRILVGPFEDETRARAAADSVARLGDDLAPRVRAETGS
jgi:cell division septation protein DedD